MLRNFSHGPASNDGSTPSQQTAQAWQQMLELSGDGILLLNDSGRISMANGRARELLRLAMDNLVGVDFWEAVPEEMATKYQREANQSLQSVREFVCLDYDPFEARWIEYGFSRQQTGIVVIMRNVTERHRLMALLRESERRSRAVFEANPHVMWVCNADNLRLLAANTAALAFYDWRREDLLSQPASQLYADGSADDLRGLLEAPELQAGSAATAMRLCKHRKRDGQVLMVETSGQILEWDGVRALLVTVTNVTGRHVSDGNLRQEKAEIERRLKERTADLEASYRELGSLTYAMSHDLQSPLHAVNGFAGTLINQYGKQLDAQGLHYLRRIKASAQQMAKLIDDLRMLSRMSRVPMQLQAFDITPICLSIIDNLRKAEPERDVDLEIEPGLLVEGDRGLVSSALLALLDNAWKFTGRKPQGWIRIALMPGAADETVVCVSDNGAGFDPAYAHKLFTAFQRLHSSAEFGGAGLGLAMAKRAVSRHNGRVWAGSSESGGASFYMALPKLGLASPSAEQPASPENL